MFEAQLEEASFADKEERARIVNELARHPHILGEVIHVLNRPMKTYWEVATQIIRVIGYPHNAAAISPLIAHVGDQNYPAWQEAVQALVEMGADVVVPHLIGEMWERERHEYWGGDVEGMCSMLCMVDREYAVRCGPTLAYILGRDDFTPHELDKGFLLEVLEKIGPDCAGYALPALLDLLRKEGTSDLGLQAKRLVASFDEKVLEPYQFILTFLEQEKG